jgi:hypothetical protein
MGHFEREAKWNVWFLLLFFVLLPLFAATIVGTFLFARTDVLQADRCLDQGGSYNYDAGECDFEQSHPPPK